MENNSVIRLMRLIKPLSIELKLEILSEISNSLKNKFQKNNIQEKENLLDELYGIWENTGDELADEIYNDKLNSTRKIDLD